MLHARVWSAKIRVVRKNSVRAARAGLVTFRNVRSWAIHVESRELPRRCALPADVVVVAFDLLRLATLAARPRAALVAENLFLRKQLALFQERKVGPRRADAATRWMMAALSQWFAWRDALVNVQADTLLRWHRQGFRLFWRWKSKTAGRPRLPINLQALIREMAADNPPGDRNASPTSCN